MPTMSFTPVSIPRSRADTSGYGSGGRVDAEASPLSLLEQINGECYLEFVDSWVVHLVDTDSIAENYTEDDITAMESVQGIYWQIGCQTAQKCFGRKHLWLPRSRCSYR